jgi:hypothetical protein
LYVKIIWENLKCKDDIEDLGVDGKIILKLFLKIGWEDVDWIHLAQIGTRIGIL